MNAYDDLKELLEEGEIVEAIVFGQWDTHEPLPPPVPPEKIGKILSLDEAIEYMKGWSFDNTFGGPGCYAMYAWTAKRLIWVGEYDTATSLAWAPRNPVELIPELSGQSAG